MAPSGRPETLVPSESPRRSAPAKVGNGIHFAFLATSKAQVDAFYRAALAAGGTGDGEPGGRPQYDEQYYGCFVRDLDGHKIEAMYWGEGDTAG